MVIAKTRRGSIRNGASFELPGISRQSLNSKLLIVFSNSSLPKLPTALRPSHRVAHQLHEHRRRFIFVERHCLAAVVLALCALGSMLSAAALLVSQPWT